MAEETDESNNMEALKRTMQYALIKNCDMNEEMRSDCVDAVISATEKYAAWRPPPPLAFPCARAARRLVPGKIVAHRCRTPAARRVPTGTRPTTSWRRGR